MDYSTPFWKYPQSKDFSQIGPIKALKNHLNIAFCTKDRSYFATRAPQMNRTRIRAPAWRGSPMETRYFSDAEYAILKSGASPPLRGCSAASRGLAGQEPDQGMWTGKCVAKCRDSSESRHENLECHRTWERRRPQVFDRMHRILRAAGRPFARLALNF